MNLKIGISGFGRIGRGVFINNYEETILDKKFDVAIIKDIMSLKQIAYLLKFDSIYGNFKGEININKNSLIVDDKEILYISSEKTTDINWNNYGINVLVESSGSVSSGKDVRKLIKNPLNNIIFTRGAPDVDLTVIMGVNNKTYDPNKHHVLSAGTCTGNAIIPLAYILNENYGIISGRITTIHPALSDQKLADVAHEIFALGRNATTSIIPTPTKVVDSIVTVIPDLEGRLSGISYRVPTSIVSIVDATFHTKEKASKEELITLLEQYEKEDLSGILKCDYGYLGNSKVTIDFLKSPFSSIALLNNISVINGNLVSLSIIHDNERGYCSRVQDIINYVYKRNLNEKK